MSFLISFSRSPSRNKWRVFTAAAVLTLLVGAAFGFGVIGRYTWQVRKNAGPSGAQLSLDPTQAAEVSMGIVFAGNFARAKLTVCNPGDAALTISTIESSCPCISLNPIPVRVEPGKSSWLEVVFDSNADPDFLGGLAVLVTGREANGAIVMRATIKLDVRRAAADRTETVGQVREVWPAQPSASSRQAKTGH
jgi:hypothetical protein